jgi:uncharacterized protein YceK
MNRPTSRVTFRFGTFLLVLLALVLTGCGTTEKKTMTEREKTLRSYSSAIRWSEFETAWAFVEPTYREAHPMTDLEVERFRQVQVTNYTVRNLNEEPDGSVSQVVEISLISKHTQVERTIVDRQKWTFDPVAKRWWNASGLPDITASR